MKVVSLAVRNLARNGRRSATTLLAMSIGLTAVLVFGGYASNVIYGLQTAVIKRSGHLEIQRAGYFESGSDTPLAYGITDYPRLIERIERDAVLRPMIALVTPTLQFGGLAQTDASGVSRSVFVDGVIAADRGRMLVWNEYGVHNYAEPLALIGTPDDSVVLGTGLAARLHLCGPTDLHRCATPSTPTGATATPDSTPPDTPGAIPDDIADLSGRETSTKPADAARVDVLAATAHGAPNVASLHAVAATNYGIKEWDDVYLVMHLSAAQRLVYGQGAAQATSILIQLQRTDQLPAARLRLEELLKTGGSPALVVLDYDRLNPMYGQSVKFLLSIFAFMAVLIGTIVLFTVGNTMSMVVAERTVEIGTLRAIGMRRSQVRRLFVVEGLVLGIAGGLVGTLVAWLVALAINHSGLTWTPPGYVKRYLVEIRIFEDPGLLAAALLGMVAVTGFSAWWPASRSSRLKIVDALRNA